MQLAKQTHGYKQTEVGVIPEDWDVKPLVLLAQVRSGVAKNANVKVSDPISVHYLRVANVQDGFLDLAEMSEIVIERPDLRRFAVLPGDVLMNEGGDRDKLGRGCVWDGQFNPCVHQNHVFVVRCTKQLYPQYLTAWTQTAVAKNFFVNAGSQTTNLASINKTALGRLPVLLPPTLAEQKAIAVALSGSDGLIETLEKLIVKKRQIKHGTMQELLTGHRRLPGFSGKWETKRIGEFTDCTAGGTPSTLIEDYWGGSIRWMSSGELNLKFVAEVEGRITQAGLQNSSAKMIPCKCVLIGLAGQGKTRGTVAMNSVELCTNQSIAAIFPSPAFVPEYLYYNLDRRYKELRDLSAGDGGRGGLNLTIIKSLDVLLPTLPEQSAIAAILSDMDAEIATLETKLTKARQVKQGMMQELLSGRTRLV